jgi:hypothetical protein
VTFIEALFHFSPDGGSGATEVSLMIALIVGLLLSTAVRLLARHQTHDEHIASDGSELSSLGKF